MGTLGQCHPSALDLSIEELMEELVRGGGSDLHLSCGLPPYGRFAGTLRPLRRDPLPREQCHRLIFSLLSSSQRKRLDRSCELDCAYGQRGVARFRVNVYREKGSYAACLRALGDRIPSLESLALPSVMREITRRPHGLVVVTGPSGSGKTTTLAALLDHINRERAKHILTIEDPIEFVHRPVRSVIHQRQLGEDTHSFGNALRAALREDPDVILVGEMRDLDTMGLAITAAETGHLVLTSLHTASAVQAVDRIVDVFPAGQQSQVRLQLSNSLQAVFAQVLCRRHNPRPDQCDRVMVQEILINTPAIANLIRTGKTAQIHSQLQTGGQQGMQTLERAIADRVNDGTIAVAEGMGHTGRPEELQRLLRPAADLASGGRHG